jgi:predicted nucleotidyltransferase
MELERLEVDLLPYVIYRCQVGSKAFGLAGEDADDDLRGIYLPPASLHWGLRKLPEQLELGKAASASGGHQPPDIKNSADEPITDQVYWELEKFLLLALKANPNVLETLWTPVVHFASPLADELRGLRQAFLSQHLYKTYSGYVLSQFRRMAAAYKTQGTFKTKHAMHLIRLLHSGIHALRTGEILIDVGEHRDELLGIKRGELTFDQVMQQALALDKQFQAEFERTTLPQQPDFEAVNAFLVKARRSAVEVST